MGCGGGRAAADGEANCCSFGQLHESAVEAEMQLD